MQSKRYMSYSKKIKTYNFAYEMVIKIYRLTKRFLTIV